MPQKAKKKILKKNTNRLESFANLRIFYVLRDFLFYLFYFFFFWGGGDSIFVWILLTVNRLIAYWLINE